MNPEISIKESILINNKKLKFNKKKENHYKMYLIKITLMWFHSVTSPKLNSTLNLSTYTSMLLSIPRKN